VKKNFDKKPPGAALPPAHFEFTHLTAARVCVAGTFNDWRPEATPMVALGEGRWVKELTLPPGVYEYRLVVDGKWMPDPRASETAPNPFGGVNSVLKVEGPFNADDMAGAQYDTGSERKNNYANQN
jgi:1,4-alpha-glucan branching enzyme